MSKHLKPAEIVDALDGALELRRQAHLDDCGTCQREVDAMRTVQRQVARADDVPEPSPLFWPLFADRIDAATTEATPAAGETGWSRWMRPLFAAAVILVVTWMVANPPRSAVPPAAPDAAASIVAAESVASTAEAAGTLWDERMEESWSLVVGFASDLEPQEVREAAMPRPGTADRLIEALTPAEQAELIKLLQAEMGSEQ
jgi:hypothetical protein